MVSVNELNVHYCWKVVFWESVESNLNLQRFAYFMNSMILIVHFLINYVSKCSLILKYFACRVLHACPVIWLDWIMEWGIDIHDNEIVMKIVTYL